MANKIQEIFCRIKDKFARSISYCFSCFVFECEQDSNTWHINDRVLIIVTNLNIHLILCTITLTNYPNRTHTMKQVDLQLLMQDSSIQCNDTVLDRCYKHRRGEPDHNYMRLYIVCNQCVL